MRLYTQPTLAYPITVTTLRCRPDDVIEQNAPLFVYKYRAWQNVYDEETRENVDKEVDLFADFETEVEGTVVSINIAVGQVLHGRTLVAEIEEPCKHEVQFGGMCANCGMDMTTVQYNQTVRNTERATINTVHGHTALLVSEEEATRADEEAKRRLLDTRKLSLVVDLDQTIIQATVDPTIAEWQQDESNPNHEAVKDVRKFQLVDDGPGGKGTWYYIKLRPGLHEFLRTISHYYEMHIYTMATRAYAHQIAKIVDPDHKLFASRILSRDENGSLSSKNLKRLFPMDTKMVVIIDDRGDVWNWSPNLVKVPPYDFFVGIGDINSSFLPKRPELEKAPLKPKKTDKPDASETPDATWDELATANDASVKPSKTSTPSPTNSDSSAVDHMLSMAGKQDEDSMKEKTKEQDETIAEQLADRPLLQKQKMLDAADVEAKASPAAEAAVEILSKTGEKSEAQEAPKYRHNLLQDDDAELENLARALRNVHQAYFDEYEKQNAGLKGGRVAELKPGHSKKRPIGELEKIPDAAETMARMKSQVLAGVHIVFSGLVPLGVDIQSYDIAIWARSFGASISDTVSKRTTHVVASPERRTAKVRQAAAKGGRIEIVNQNWLYACFNEWKHVPEGPYRIHGDAQPNGASAQLPESFDETSYFLSSSDDEAAQTESETEGMDIEIPNGAEMGRADVDTDLDSEELEQYAPPVERRNSSPLEEVTDEDWGSIMGEVNEFIGSEADESDRESIRSEWTDGTKTPSGQRKRKRDGLAEEGADSTNEDGAEGESRLQKRKKEAIARTSGLANVASVLSLRGLTPLPTGVEPGGAGSERRPETEGEENDDNDNIINNNGDDDGLEAALAAEMERQSDEDEGNDAVEGPT